MIASDFAEMVIVQKIALAEYTSTMLRRALPQIRRAQRDTTVVRHYQRETEAYLTELRADLAALQLSNSALPRSAPSVHPRPGSLAARQQLHGVYGATL